MLHAAEHEGVHGEQGAQRGGGRGQRKHGPRERRGAVRGPAQQEDHGEGPQQRIDERGEHGQGQRQLQAGEASRAEITPQPVGRAHVRQPGLAAALHPPAALVQPRAEPGVGLVRGRRGQHPDVPAPARDPHAEIHPGGGDVLGPPAQAAQRLDAEVRRRAAHRGRQGHAPQEQAEVGRELSRRELGEPRAVRVRAALLRLNAHHPGGKAAQRRDRLAELAGLRPASRVVHNAEFTTGSAQAYVAGLGRAAGRPGRHEHHLERRPQRHAGHRRGGLAVVLGDQQQHLPPVRRIVQAGQPGDHPFGAGTDPVHRHQHRVHRQVPVQAGGPGGPGRAQPGRGQHAREAEHHHGQVGHDHDGDRGRGPPQGRGPDPRGAEREDGHRHTAGQDHRPGRLAPARQAPRTRLARGRAGVSLACWPGSRSWVMSLPSEGE